MEKKVVVLQSSYIPWRGYFDLINQADEFIFYDDVQFTKRDWRTRNKIKTAQGLQWLTIPVQTKGKYYQKINEVQVVDHKWCSKHWMSICNAYSKAPFFTQYKNFFEQMYSEIKNFSYLSEINCFMIKKICEVLGIHTTFTQSSDYGFSALCKTERLVAICKSANAAIYISGPSARDYIKQEMFKNEEIKIQYINYNNYADYPQRYGDFASNVSVIDLIFNKGPKSLNYISNRDVSHLI